MTFKNILYKSAICAAALFVASCSDISEDNRLVYVKPAQVNRMVLIEDFTGQNCSNCPKATDEIESLMKQYGEENIIAVGIHSGPLGFKGNSKYLGLKTDLGDEYYSYWGVKSQPNGMVNRTTSPCYFTEWGNIVRTEIAKVAPVSLTIENKYDESSRNLEIKTEVMGTDGYTKGKVQIWLIEDDITTLQKQPSGKIDYEYVHKHVLRTSVNGTWGEEISVNEGETKSLSHSFAIPAEWNADKISVVAFVCGSDNRNVMQVTKKAIK